jgi:hypothetical protein
MTSNNDDHLKAIGKYVEPEAPKKPKQAFAWGNSENPCTEIPMGKITTGTISYNKLLVADMKWYHDMIYAPRNRGTM